jgi:hypothetical protein
MKNCLVSIATSLLLAAASLSQAETLVTNSFNSVAGGAGLAVSATDLVNAGQPTLAGYAESVAPQFGPFNANDGVATNASDAAGFWRVSLPVTITFELNLSSNALGYDITRIDSFAGWQGGGTQTYANQKFTVEYSVVGSADFTPLSAVDYSPFTSTTSSNPAYTQCAITENSSGILASGVDAIRFVYSTPTVSGGTNGGLVLQEIDVAGVPTGSPPGVVITPESSAGTPFASTAWAANVSAADLINAGQPTLAAASVSSVFFGPNGINNGSAIPAETTTNTYFSAPDRLPATATYDLNVSTNPNGYVITSIESFMGWQANSAAHANQTYTVAVSLVGSPDYTDLAVVSYSPFGTDNSADHESHVLVSHPSGILATGVDGIRFTFTALAYGGSSPGTVVREIDVYGHPVGGEPPANSVTVASPKVRQVIQRGAENSASVPVSGSYTGTPDVIEARMVVMPGGGNSGSDTEWTEIVGTPAGGTFSGMLADVSAGGWYQVEVRSVTDDVPGNTTVVERVGIGDIYITCGQSNSANYGGPAGTTTDDRVSAWNFSGGAWTKAADPMPGAGGGGGSVWPRLGDLLAARENVPIAFACLGVGSTTVAQWVPPGGYYPQLKTAVQNFPANGFRAALWHQGESDSLASTPPATYQTRIQSIITQSRADAGWTVPWYLAEVGFHPSSNLAQEEQVVAGQRRAIFADTQVFPGPVTDDFHLEGKLNDSVHFNAAGLAAHAEQWAEVLGGVPPLVPKNGDFESNPALADGGIAGIDTAALTSPSVIGWRVLADSGEAVADGACGYYNPDDSFYPGALDGGGGVLPNMSGRHVAFLSGSSAGTHFLQTRRAMLIPGHTYTLTAAIGVRGNATTFGGARLELLANGAVLASRNVSEADLDALNSGNASGTFTDISLTLSTGSSVPANQPLAVSIRKTTGAGTYLDFDNVRLAAALTPFATWQIDHWGDAANPAAAWTADPDGDLLANAFEYHLGVDPLVSDAPSFLSSVNHDGKDWQRYEVALDPTVDSAGLEMVYSFDLDTWHPAASNPGNTIVAEKTATSWSLEVSSTDHPRTFFRLVGTQPE